MERRASNVATQARPHNGIDNELSTSTAIDPTSPLQQDGSITPKAAFANSESDIKFEAGFENSALIKIRKVLEVDLQSTSDVVERLLWRRVLEARLKLMQHVLLREGPHPTNQRLLSSLDTDVDKHSEAIQAFQITKDLFLKVGNLSVEENMTLLSHAARIVTAYDYERQADRDKNKDLRLFISRKRTWLVEAEKTLLDNHMWLGFGKRNRNSGSLLAFLDCLVTAVFGGLVLLIPMMIMVLNPTKLTVLVTTIVCVFFVAVAISAMMNTAQPKDIFSATAAYAAVLVVFVGTTTTTTDESNRVIGAIAGGVLGGILLLVGLWFGFFYTLFSRREKGKGSMVSSTPPSSLTSQAKGV